MEEWGTDIYFTREERHMGTLPPYRDFKMHPLLGTQGSDSELFHYLCTQQQGLPEAKATIYPAMLDRCALA